MRYLRIFAILILAITSFCASADALLDRARAYLKSGNPQQAWKMLAPKNAERSGEVEFDYLLGIAALDTGRRTEAVFALERVLAIDPGHAEARAEIARAYFELNETERAKTQFDKVLQDDSIPAKARLEIGSYLSAIEAIESDAKTDWNLYLSFTLGNDDNVNTGPSSSQVAVPIFGGAIVTLADATLPQESAFSQTRLRFNLQHGINDKTRILAGIGIAQRINTDSEAEAFDNGSLDLNFGFRFLHSETNHFTVSIQGQDFMLDGEDYRDATGLLAQWRNRISSNREISLYGKSTKIEFDDQTSRDADRNLVGGGFSQFFPSKRNPLLYLGFYTGAEKIDDGASSYLGYDFVGIRVGAKTKYNDRIELFGSINLEERDYDDTDPTFLRTREDTYTSASLGMRYKYNKQLNISPEIFWSENESNIDLNENDKTSYSVTLRYDF